MILAAPPDREDNPVVCPLVRRRRDGRGGVPLCPILPGRCVRCLAVLTPEYLFEGEWPNDHAERP